MRCSRASAQTRRSEEDPLHHAQMTCHDPSAKINARYGPQPCPNRSGKDRKPELQRSERTAQRRIRPPQPVPTSKHRMAKYSPARLIIGPIWAARASPLERKPWRHTTRGRGTSGLGRGTSGQGFFSGEIWGLHGDPDSMFPDGKVNVNGCKWIPRCKGKSRLIYPLNRCVGSRFN